MVRGRFGAGGGGGAWVGPEFEWCRPCRVKYGSSVKRRVKLYMVWGAGWTMEGGRYESSLSKRNSGLEARRI